MFFSIILPTYNRLYAIKKFIFPSLHFQTFTDYEIIVVDDASIDKTQQYFETNQFEKEFPKFKHKIQYIRHKKNLNTANSKNTGAKIANGNWLFIVEDDITIEDKTFLTKAHRLINQYVRQYANLAVLSPKREELTRDMYFYNKKGKFVTIGKLSKTIYLDPDQEYTGFVLTTHQTSFIKTDIYLKFLSDGTNFDYYREETEFFYRLTKNNYLILYVGNQLKTIHNTNQSKKGGSLFKANLLKKEILFFRYHYIWVKKHFRFPFLSTVCFFEIRVLKNIINLVFKGKLKKKLKHFISSLNI